MQAKEAKYWAFELYATTPVTKVAKSPRKDKGNGMKERRREREREKRS